MNIKEQSRPKKGDELAIFSLRRGDEVGRFKAVTVRDGDRVRAWES